MEVGVKGNLIWGIIIRVIWIKPQGMNHLTIKGNL